MLSHEGAETGRKITLVSPDVEYGEFLRVGAEALGQSIIQVAPAKFSLVLIGWPETILAEWLGEAESPDVGG
ncbi:hypothetical protein SAMN05216554_1991 [Herbiconiux ginsengi]|uniref:Uncharacterized protein n=2 Tax=Herbiconiux ginsengi TaxID=381665 RepID=A0A1H3PN71_9MICO|nr:hypothetical protein SAMN05216554_1991 [Herbiconiux ginsengi]